MKIIMIEDLKEKLNYTDLRPIRKWCKKNNVLITKQGKNEFVFETDFELAFELPIINKLKLQFGKEWESVYRLHKDGNVPALNMLHDTPSVTYKTYKSASSKNKFQEKLEAYAKNNAA